MQQPITAENFVDADGNPAGGYVVSGAAPEDGTRNSGAPFLNILWQNGPLGRGADRKEPNGAFVETVIAAALQRIQFYNEGKFRCRENSLAITHLEDALHWLQHRTADREVRNVEGTHTQ